MRRGGDYSTVRAAREATVEVLLRRCYCRGAGGETEREMEPRGDLCKGEGRAMNMREKRALCEGGLGREGEIRAVK